MEEESSLHLQLRRLIADKDVRITALEMMVIQLTRELDTAKNALSSFEETETTMNQLNDKFDRWTDELSDIPKRKFGDSCLLPLMLTHRPAHISRCMELTSTPLILTSSEHPFRIVYTNAAWSNLCGWESHEAAGATCALLQGRATDRDRTDELCDSASETGYGAAELINYKRDGTPFRNRVALIPVYNNVDAPVLTNTLGLLDAIDLSDSERVEAADLSTVERSISMPPMSKLEIELMQMPFTDLTGCTLDMIATFMTLTEEALVLTNQSGQICSVNRPWVQLCGYTLREIEGCTCRFLQGPKTCPEQILELNRKTSQQEVVNMKITNYKKSGAVFENALTILPITHASDAVGEKRSFFLARLYDTGAHIQ